jgi:hypothetical protein
MSLRYKYNRALHILDRLSPKDREKARCIARQIRQAQEELLERADGHFDRCVSLCRGLCCRNVALDAVISVWDFVYILIIDRSIGRCLEACLDRENPFFAADCVFLQNGRGPCLLPFNLRPEVCITTFCTSVKPVAKEIRTVKWKFARLTVFVVFARARQLLKPLVGSG